MHAHYRTNLSYRMSICAPIVYILCERFNYVIGRDNDPCRPWIICLAQPQKGVKEGRPSGPSPHVRVTQQCKATSSHLCMEPKETRQNNSRKYMGIRKSACCLWLLASTLFTMLSVSNHSISFKALLVSYTHARRLFSFFFSSSFGRLMYCASKHMHSWKASKDTWYGGL